MSYKAAIIGYGGMGEWHHKNIKERIPQIDNWAYDVREEAEIKHFKWFKSFHLWKNY